jgi:hypothetical protein
VASTCQPFGRIEEMRATFDAMYKEDHLTTAVKSFLCVDGCNLDSLKSPNPDRPLVLLPRSS